MAAIGKRGFNSLVNRHFLDEKEATAWLRKQAGEKQIARLAQEEMARMGETCVEVPVLLEPDADPFFREVGRKWRDQVTGPKIGGRR